MLTKRVEHRAAVAAQEFLIPPRRIGVKGSWQLGGSKATKADAGFWVTRIAHRRQAGS